MEIDNTASRPCQAGQGSWESQRPPCSPARHTRGGSPPYPHSSCTGCQQVLTAKARVCSKSRESQLPSPGNFLKQHWPLGEGSLKACGQHGEWWRPLFTYNRRVFQLYLQDKYDCNYLPLTMHLEDSNSSQVLLSSGKSSPSRKGKESAFFHKRPLLLPSSSQ